MSYDQMDRLKPPGHVSPDAHEAHYDGPFLLDEARIPINRFFAQTFGQR